MWKIAGGVLLLILLTGCSEENEGDIEFPDAPYPSAQAKDNGDLVIAHDGVSNEEALVQFRRAAEAGEEGSLRIAEYTEEGDPVFTNLHVDDGSFEIVYDNSLDAFAGADSGQQSAVCDDMTEEQESSSSTSYQFNGCSNEFGESFSFMVQE